MALCIKIYKKYILPITILFKKYCKIRRETHSQGTCLLNTALACK